MKTCHLKTHLLTLALAGVLWANVAGAEYQFSPPTGQIHGFTPYIVIVGATGELFVGSTLAIRTSTIADGLGGSYEFNDDDGDEQDVPPTVEWLAVPKDETTDANAIVIARGLEYTIPLEFITDFPDHKIGYRITARSKTGLTNTSVPLFVHNALLLAGQKNDPNNPAAPPELDEGKFAPNPGVIADDPSGVPQKDMKPVALIFELTDFEQNGANAKPVSNVEIKTKVATDYVARIIKSTAGVKEDVSSEFINNTDKPIHWRIVDKNGIEIPNAISPARLRGYTYQGQWIPVYRTQTTNDDAADVLKTGSPELSEQGLRLQAGFDDPDAQ